MAARFYNMEIQLNKMQLVISGSLAMSQQGAVNQWLRFPIEIYTLVCFLDAIQLRHLRHHFPTMTLVYRRICIQSYLLSVSFTMMYIPFEQREWMELVHNKWPTVPHFGGQASAATHPLAVSWGEVLAVIELERYHKILGFGAIKADGLDTFSWHDNFKTTSEELLSINNFSNQWSIFVVGFGLW